MAMAYQNLTISTISVILIAVLIAISRIGATRGRVDCPANEILYDDDRTQRTADEGKVQQYSIHSVPEFCSTLKRPVGKELPMLTPSLTGFELNELGKAGLLAQDDVRVLNYLWDHCDVFLRPPDGTKTRYEGRNPSMGQVQIVRKLLETVTTNGFYVEAGAFDGVRFSNSFLFEKKYGWKGLLLEPDPSNLRKLHRHGRNGWISHSCLSLVPYPQEVAFETDSALGRVVHPDFPLSPFRRKYSHLPEGKKGSQTLIIQVQCFPLYSYLAALNVSTVDYFSLDIEGHELQVLKTIPFDKVLIRVLSVEFKLSPGGEGPMRAFMESKGYITAHRVLNRRRVPVDLIFVHKSVDVPPGVLEELAVGL